MPATSPARRGEQSFRHEAMVYSGHREFVERVARFIRDGLVAEEAVLVAVDPPKIDALREELGSHAADVAFADMRELGSNPARIIPAWRRFVSSHGLSGRALRGVGEPVWPGRSEAELAECRLHEWLLNVAFEDSPGFWLMCPYDAGALDAQALDYARETHPLVAGDGGGGCFCGTHEDVLPFIEPLPDPAGECAELRFGSHNLAEVRRFSTARAARAGLDADRVEDLVIAVNELATNSVRHGGGDGLLRLWEENGALVCDVRDAGLVGDPLVGRVQPAPGQIGGCGLWLVNRVCDLVQIRSSEAGTTVRAQMRIR